MTGAWTIEDEHKIDRHQSEVWSNEWIQDTAIASEEIIMLDLVTNVVQNIGT